MCLADRYGTDVVLTLDRRHVRAVACPGRDEPFRLLPDDL
jgi:hypothetical protein